MIAMMPDEELGRALLRAGFRPLPYVNHDGELVGTELWRLRPGYVECLRLYPSGQGLGVRALAIFDYHRPFEHGEIVDAHAGQAVTALNWLLASAPIASPPLPRPYRSNPPRATRDSLDNEEHWTE